MVILNAEQAREYNRAQALALCLNEETDVYTLYQPFDAEAQLFFLSNKKLLSLVPAKNSNGTVITEDKGDLKTTIALSANIICTRTAAYAIKIGDKDLEAAVYHSTTAVRELKDADVLGFVTLLTGVVSPLLSKADFLPYAVTSDMLAAITQNATDFNNSIGKATFAGSKSSYASATIDDVLKDIRNNIVQFNLLLNFFEEKYSGFVKEYGKASAIDYSGIRHSGIQGVITNPLTGAPIQGVTITGEGKKKITRTDKDGVYKLSKLKVGDMKITITAPGYESQVIDVKISRGKISELNIALSAQAIATATA